jgi:hypothetical protein
MAAWPVNEKEGDTVSRKQVIIWMIQAFHPPDLEVVDRGPNGAVVVSRNLRKAS